ncbi:hypothetical protein EJ08DRAFT_653392 [Tothia fuscella]|uniref:MARVEL domain-containing protein n=1 Tax=Tothia fuscella TaxID=1048955 RepID=A0A9P4NHT5_9PEZI|nr:hypothetical protein EJ08DRAFT_653392 [Tothia fuscella]
MILTRMLSFIFRFVEFVSAAVVLGIVGHFLRIRHKTGTGPRGREIYTEVVAAISVVLSLVWLLPFTANIMHYPLDVILSFAWFAAFGALVNWLHKLNCGGAFQWQGLTHGGQCNQWRAAEAFAFISACFWLASAILGFFIRHKARKGETTTVATDGATYVKFPYSHLFHSSYIDSPRRSYTAEENLYPPASERKHRAVSLIHIPVSPSKISTNEFFVPGPAADASDANQLSRAGSF